MYNKQIKIALIVIITGFAIYQFYPLVNIFYGILLLLLAGLILLSIYKNEYVIAAFYYMRKNEPQKALAYLHKIKYPERLLKNQQAYYYFLNGLAEIQLRGMGKAETFFKKALNIGLRMKTDQAVAYLNLAGIYLSKRNKKVATHYLGEAKKADNKKLLSDQIKEFDKHLKRI
jgi:tetratricopeptide (TPR) repeat protein